MKTIVLRTLLLIAAIPAACLSVSAQPGDKKKFSYDSLSLKELLNIKIVSVSKQSESLFEAPLSASVITKEEIRRAGCNSIMEAMRLVPGVIVRQQSNGNYDIHLRGMDNVPLNASFDIASTTTLVMIDSRPIYSYLRGGTFWETLPVDLNDVERIEVVRGPAAALYGPNAVNGVVNIITRRTRKDGLYIVANNQQGSNRTFINNASIGYQSNKWSAIASGNYQGRKRSQTSYFEFNRNMWIDHPDYFLNFRNDTAFNISERFPHQDLAMEKYAGNLYLNYDGANKTKIALSTGLQHSTVQKISAENENTPLSTASSSTKYVDLRAQVKGMTAQVSYNGGQQNVDFDPGNKYDFHTLDANAEYNYSRKNFSIKPGISYRSALYDDSKYSDTANKAGIFNAHGKITTLSFSIRAEYKMLKDKLRLVAGVSSNKFNYPDTNYIAFQFAATYKINKKQMVRLVYSQAPRSSNIFDTYVDQTIAFFPSGYRKFTRMGLWGNKNLKLLTADMLEAGYRYNISPALNIDLELFDIRARNTNILITSAPFGRVAGNDTIIEIPIRATNLPLRVHQQGLTATITYNVKKMQLKGFVTIQKTQILDYAPYHNTPDAGAGPNNIYSAMGSKVTHRSTPTVFGGGFINYMPSRRLNLNVNAYYYSAQTYFHLSNVLFDDAVRGIDQIKAKLNLNTNISYEAAKGLKVFLNVKNILNDKSREFFKADEAPRMLLAGLTYEL